MSSLLTTAQQASYKIALNSVFDTFARPFLAYVEAQQVTISTDINWSRFGQHDQNVLSPPVTPQAYLLTGCIRYANNQPYDYMGPYPGAAAEQLKLRESDGKVRIKVEASGHAIMQQAKRVVLDGMPFEIESSPRPHGIVGQPDRWTYSLNRID